jgi:hypothetical protein
VFHIGLHGGKILIAIVTIHWLIIVIRELVQPAGSRLDPIL